MNSRGNWLIEGLRSSDSVPAIYDGTGNGTVHDDCAAIASTYWYSRTKKETLILFVALKGIMNRKRKCIENFERCRL